MFVKSSVDFTTITSFRFTSFTGVKSHIFFTNFSHLKSSKRCQQLGLSQLVSRPVNVRTISTDVSTDFNKSSDIIGDFKNTSFSHPPENTISNTLPIPQSTQDIKAKSFHDTKETKFSFLTPTLPKLPSIPVTLMRQVFTPPHVLQILETTYKGKMEIRTRKSEIRAEGDVPDHEIHNKQLVEIGTAILSQILVKELSSKFPNLRAGGMLSYMQHFEQYFGEWATDYEFSKKFNIINLSLNLGEPRHKAKIKLFKAYVGALYTFNERHEDAVEIIKDWVMELARPYMKIMTQNYIREEREQEIFKEALIEHAKKTAFDEAIKISQEQYTSQLLKLQASTKPISEVSKSIQSDVSIGNTEKKKLELVSIPEKDQKETKALGRKFLRKIRRKEKKLAQLKQEIDEEYSRLKDLKENVTNSEIEIGVQANLEHEEGTLKSKVDLNKTKETDVSQNQNNAQQNMNENVIIIKEKKTQQLENESPIKSVINDYDILGKNFWPPLVPKINDEKLRRRVFSRTISFDKSEIKEIQDKLFDKLGGIMLTNRRACYEINSYGLELFGDSIIALVVTKALTKRFPLATTGELSLLRSKLVSNQNLSRLFKAYIIRNMLLPLDLQSDFGNIQHANLAGDYQAAVFEAYVGGLYLSREMEEKNEYSAWLSVAEWILALMEPAVANFENKVYNSPEYLREEVKAELLWKDIAVLHNANGTGGDLKNLDQALMLAGTFDGSVIRNDQQSRLHLEKILKSLSLLSYF